MHHLQADTHSLGNPLHQKSSGMLTSTGVVSGGMSHGNPQHAGTARPSGSGSAQSSSTPCRHHQHCSLAMMLHEQHVPGRRGGWALLLRRGWGTWASWPRQPQSRAPSPGRSSRTAGACAAGAAASSSACAATGWGSARSLRGPSDRAVGQPWADQGQDCCKNPAGWPGRLESACQHAWSWRQWRQEALRHALLDGDSAGWLGGVQKAEPSECREQLWRCDALSTLDCSWLCGCCRSRWTLVPHSQTLKSITLCDTVAVTWPEQPSASGPCLRAGKEGRKGTLRPHTLTDQLYERSTSAWMAVEVPWGPKYTKR